MSTSYRRHVAIIATLLITVLSHASHAYDLRQDWSDSANPNGPWSYRVGTTLLPHVPDWTAGVNFPAQQPAYLPSNSPGGFLPAWFKLTAPTPGFDANVGDIIVHTNDGFNGNPSQGKANVLFTVPMSGQYIVRGNLWNANTTLVASDFRPRPQNWEILVNGVPQDSGLLDAIPGHFTRANPDLFDLGTLSLQAGDFIELDIFKNSAAQAGFFVAANLAIIPYPGQGVDVPEPVSIAILLSGMAALGIARRRRCDAA